MNQLYGSNLRSLRTYNRVSSNAPIFKACLALDLPEVRRLFKIGAASPMDVSIDHSISLIDEVFRQYAMPNRQLELVKKRSEWLAFLAFLIQSSGREIQTHMLCGCLLFLDDQIRKEGENFLLWTETIRLIATCNAKDPFEYEFACALINDPLHPLYPIISSQDNWWIESDFRVYRPNLKGCFVESIRDMITDPLGKSLRQALSKGMKYVPYIYETWWRIFRYDIVDKIQCNPYGFLLNFAAKVNNEIITSACTARLVIFLEYQYDPRRLYHPRRDELWHLPRPHVAVSSTGYAEFLGLQQTWESALVLAGWSLLEIQHLKDEETFLGIPDLLDGNVVYSTLVEQRVAFINNLRCGFCADMSDNEIEDVADLMESELAASPFELKSVILEASSCFKQYSTPGSWFSGEDVRLEPVLILDFHGIGSSTRMIFLGIGDAFVTSGSGRIIVHLSIIASSQ